ncbi:MAG: glucuronate isomerase [Christensenellales bacterium]|jgi:glucuronate isomerase
MEFIGDNFLLNSELSINLYNNYCTKLPIFDYHCHLSTEELYLDKPYNNLYEIWLKHDHYKWRLMRFNLTSEEIISGKDAYQCYLAYVKALEKAADNPLYIWSHLELRRCFEIDEVIKSENARAIWDKANEYIINNRFSPRAAVKKFNVHTIVTTEEIYAELKYHKLLKDSGFETVVLPAFRGDALINLDFNAINKMSEVTGVEIKDLAGLSAALNAQLDRFHKAGCVAADIATEGLEFEPVTGEDAAAIFNKAVSGQEPTEQEKRGIKTYLLIDLMRLCYQRDWAVQLHIGASRNNNTKMYSLIGADSGFDSISDRGYIKAVGKLLDTLCLEGSLKKTVIYNLNPSDNYLVGAMLGNFAGCADMQLGAAWWFNDNKYGIINMLRDYASLSLLGNCLGMLTDSRSFISFTRHEFFRRLLCDYLADLVIRGEYPNDYALLSQIIKGICFENAKEFFNISGRIL